MHLNSSMFFMKAFFLILLTIQLDCESPIFDYEGPFFMLLSPCNSRILIVRLVHILWQQVIAELLEALEKTHTWDMVNLPAGKTSMGCKWLENKNLV